jgi:hypothetical protein
MREIFKTVRFQQATLARIDRVNAPVDSPTFRSPIDPYPVGGP